MVSSMAEPGRNIDPNHPVLRAARSIGEGIGRPIGWVIGIGQVFKIAWNVARRR